MAEFKEDLSSIDEAVDKLLIYCSNVQTLIYLKSIVSNLIVNPGHKKFQLINTESSAFKKHLDEEDLGKEFLEAIGFVQEGDNCLAFHGSHDILIMTLEKLEKAQSDWLAQDSGDTEEKLSGDAVGDSYTPLPMGWEMKMSNGKPYYFHSKSKVSRWTRPTDEESEAMDSQYKNSKKNTDEVKQKANMITDNQFTSGKR